MPRRSARVWEALGPVLRPEGDVAVPLDVLDLGGGTGGLAVAMAELGHRVTVVDPSPNALAALERRAAEAGVTSLVEGVIGDATTLSEHAAPGSADVLVCHGVLEFVDDPREALRSAAVVLRAGGHLSLLVAQRSGAVLARIIGGHIDEAAAMLQAGSATIPRRFTREEIETMVAEAGFGIVAVQGVAIFTDHVSSRIVDGRPGAAAQLAELEDLAGGLPDFMPLATRLHLLARKS